MPGSMSVAMVLCISGDFGPCLIIIVVVLASLVLSGWSRGVCGWQPVLQQSLDL